MAIDAKLIGVSTMSRRQLNIAIRGADYIFVDAHIFTTAGGYTAEGTAWIEVSKAALRRALPKDSRDDPNYYLAFVRPDEPDALYIG